MRGRGGRRALPSPRTQLLRAQLHACQRPACCAVLGVLWRVVLCAPPGCYIQAALGAPAAWRGRQNSPAHAAPPAPELTPHHIGPAQTQGPCCVMCAHTWGELSQQPPGGTPPCLDQDMPGCQGLVLPAGCAPPWS